MTYYFDMDGVLVDDDEKNTRQWERSGHTAMLIERGAAVVL